MLRLARLTWTESNKLHSVNRTDRQCRAVMGARIQTRMKYQKIFFRDTSDSFMCYGRPSNLITVSWSDNFRSNIEKWLKWQEQFILHILPPETD